MHSFDYDAYEFLKEKKLIDTDICPKCGFSPINTDYKFIKNNDSRIQTSICYQCWKEKRGGLRRLFGL
jgi:hypothetical protein